VFEASAAKLAEVNPAEQSQFDFGGSSGEQGWRRWHEQRREAHRQLARKLGLPLDRKVEVWLHGEIRLVGTLRLREQTLFLPEESNSRLELMVDNVRFTPGEMASCVAID
jgi:hypothetical protein